MKNSNPKLRSKKSGEGLVVVIILLLIIGAGAWYLFHNKWTMDQEARAFGREMIQRVTVNHDLAFFQNNLGPQARMENAPSQQETIIAKFKELGVPQQPIKIEENVTFESKFFSPRAYFTAHLFYPTQTMTLQIAISHPVGKWQLDNLSFGSGPGG
ncbi:MAG: hypothetical protein ABI925_12810 [Verrucomicrobiota bacterium]